MAPQLIALSRLRARPRREIDVDAARLAQILRERIAGEVRFDDGDRALYATDGSNYRQVPIGVVVPHSIDDVLQTIATCREFGAPLLSRGGGTSLAGQCCNVAVVIDWSKRLNALESLDVDQRRARVQPGCVLDVLRKAAWQHDLTFAPDPSTHAYCTLGGMIGNNSCGVHSVMGGRTVDNVESLDIVTYDGVRLTVGPTSDDELAERVRQPGRVGQIYRDLVALRDRYARLIRARYPKIPRRVSGYSLDELLPENGFNVARALVGAEGTCVTVLGATVRLIPWPKFRSLLALGYPSVYEAADHVVEVRESGCIALEGLDDRLIDDMKKKGIHPQDITLLPPGKGWLNVEFGGDTKAEADAKAHALMARL
ncbi:MAG TPA: FAD-binding oxidoreductase, partial [Polyangia bacterium]|nr:FAD-binding oxidoreductase [Polyangia bacterium]